MSHNAFFSSLSEKKKHSFDVGIVVKNKSKCGLAWSVLLSTKSTRHYTVVKICVSEVLSKGMVSFHLLVKLKAPWKSINTNTNI